MASLSTAVVLILATSTSLAFPQRPLASYNNQMASSQPSYSSSPVGFYIVPMQSGGRMGSFGQFGSPYGSPYGMQQPHYVLVNPGYIAPQYNPAESRVDVLAHEQPNAKPKPVSSKDPQQNDADTESLTQADPQQSFNSPQGGPMYIVLNQGPQMAYYDLLQQLGANYLPGSQPLERRGYMDRGDYMERRNFVPFRPASHYRSHEPARRRSQKPVGMSYAYPNLFTRQQSYDDDEDSDEGVVIEASSLPQRRAQQVDSEKVEAAEPAGPSVAQAKPQAIAMAGPGGVAAATPMATAVVGPGGMAVAAPSATAVAGPSGGKPPIALGGSTNAALTAAYKAQMKAERKQDQFSAVSLGGRLVAPIGTSQSDGKYSSYGMY